MLEKYQILIFLSLNFLKSLSFVEYFIILVRDASPMFLLLILTFDQVKNLFNNSGNSLTVYTQCIVGIIQRLYSNFVKAKI